MAQYRKKPVVIEAWPYKHNTPLNLLPADIFCQLVVDNDKGDVVIKTLEGAMSVSPGDWIIKGVKGELYPCKPDIFEATYEKVETNDFKDNGNWRYS